VFFMFNISLVFCQKYTLILNNIIKYQLPLTYLYSSNECSTANSATLPSPANLATKFQNIYAIHS
jgi:hypothetical protein